MRPPGTQPAARHTPLSAEEKVRAEANFVPLVAEHLRSGGRFRVSADTPEMVELFQGVARRVGDLLGRPVVSYANGRYIVIAFGEQATTSDGAGGRPRSSSEA
ncbi:hypothetical protein [Nonomuraea rhodomycinica]|uniref:Uncharacterized protein n=1 Tax=Nonomuraea rhodomycinica TaxID=1712872 RepID=A0A7Y6IWL3_9ACTN|nr:hypothetical protein [Nonomuraea rhodomycinica]NUW45403.1 hypothetical protein [Nonomuraea rhodomycinica]